MLLVPTEIAEGLSVPPDVAVLRYDGPGRPIAHLDRVRFYVPPYLGVTADLSLMARMPALEVCQLPTAGFDHALAHLPAGVLLCNAAGVHDASTAELAVALILARLRGIDAMARAMPAGVWASGRMSALADRRVLVLGAGGIGRALAARLRPFDCEVILVGRSARDDIRGADEVPALLAGADVVVLAVPLDDATRGLVDAAFLARMRDGALLVNVSRGAVVVTAALLAEVRSGRLQAALDVTDPEPLPADHELWRSPGVLISPHVGGNTSAFLPRMRALLADQLARWQRGESLHHVVATGRGSGDPRGVA